MSPDGLEELLASMPTKTLSPTAEAEILQAMAKAGPQPAHWWTRPLPLWQAGAACLLIAVAAGLLGSRSGIDNAARVGQAAPDDREPGELPRIVKIVQPDKPLFGRPESSGYALDIRHWQVNAAPRMGDQTQ